MHFLTLSLYNRSDYALPQQLKRLIITEGVISDLEFYADLWETEKSNTKGLGAENCNHMIARGTLLILLLTASFVSFVNQGAGFIYLLG